MRKCSLDDEPGQRRTGYIPGVADAVGNRRQMAERSRDKTTTTARLWPLLGLNFFMADMQSGIGPFVGVFLADRGWASGLIGTALTIGNIAGMLITTRSAP